MSSTSRKPRSKGKAEKPKKEAVVEEIEGEVKKAEKAVVKEAKKVERSVVGKAARKSQPPRPTGRAPGAMVMARRGSVMVTRAGRGFSLRELSGAGLAPRLAAKWGAQIDLRRRSVLDGNVGALKAWHATGAKARVEREAKVVEQELEKVGKEVKKEAAAIEKEAVKAEKAVKKEAKKAVKKVEKKARPKKKP